MKTTYIIKYNEEFAPYWNFNGMTYKEVTTNDLEEAIAETRALLAANKNLACACVMMNNLPLWHGVNN